MEDVLSKRAKFMNKFITTLGIALVLVSQAVAQGGYRIEAKFAGITGGECKLVFHYGDQMYVAKDGRIDPEGKVVFEGEKPLDRGLYLLAFPRRVVEVFVGDEQNFSISVDTANVVGTIQFTGSEDNQRYYDYQRELREDQNKFEALFLKKELNKPDADKNEIREIAIEYNKEQRKKIAKLAKKHPKSLSISMLRGYLDPELPSPKKPDGGIDSTALYFYHKAHYFDNMNFDEEGIVRSPMLHQRLKAFFDNMVSPYTDSITKESDIILAKAQNRAVRKYIVSYLSKRYEVLRTLGQDGIYPYLLEKYYLNEPHLWDSTTIASAQKVVDIQKPLIIGKIIPNLILTDTLGRPIELHDIKADYTLLFLYNPGCGHCKGEAPHLLELYETAQSKDFKLMIMTGTVFNNETDWLGFIRQFKLQPLLNGRDAWGTVDFNRFNTFAYPTLYILDKDKRIVAKHIEVKQVMPLIEADIEFKKMKAAREAEKTK
jgi:thiol-disulfide isomerase/thioredoxin